MKTMLTVLIVSLVALPAGAVPTATPFDLNAGGGAVFEGFENDSADAVSILTTSGDVFIINDASIGGADDAFDEIFEIAVGIDAFPVFTVADDDGTVDVVTNASGSRVQIDAVGDPGVPAGFDVAAEYFVFANEPLARVVFSVTNNTGNAADVDVEIASDSGTGTPVMAATASGDLLLDTNDTYHVRMDTLVSPDPLQTHVQYGVGAPTTPSIVRINPSDDDDTQVLFELGLAAGQTQSLMLFAAVTDPNSPTAVADAVGLASQLDGTLNQLDASGFLVGLDPGLTNTIVNYAGSGPNTAVPEPVTAALGVMGLGVLGMATRRRAA